MITLKNEKSYDRHCVGENGITLFQKWGSAVTMSAREYSEQWKSGLLNPRQNAADGPFFELEDEDDAINTSGDRGFVPDYVGPDYRGPVPVY